MLMGKFEENLSVEEILNKKFQPSKIGYNPVEVDKFLDKVILTVNNLDLIIKALNEKIVADQVSYKKLVDQYNELETRFYSFKNQYKNIKETDFIDNKNSIELLKKINIYEKKLSELGIDPTSLK